MDENEITADLTPEEQAEHKVMEALEDTLELMRNSRPDERSETARRWAIAITEMEKTVAYFDTFLFCGHN